MAISQIWMWKLRKVRKLAQGHTERTHFQPLRPHVIFWTLKFNQS